MDQGVGRVVAKLKEKGEYDNTLIMFLSDNGGCHEAVSNWNSIIQKGGEAGTPESFDSYERNWRMPVILHSACIRLLSMKGEYQLPFVARYPKLIPRA